MANASTLMDQAQDKVQDLADTSRSRLRQVADVTTDYAQRGLERVKDTGAAALRDTALDARDATLDYVRDEPMKAILMAAAAGAALAASFMLIRRMYRR